MGAAPELPSGTVTFLFTDIEGSTRLLKRLREGYGRVLAEHQALLRAAFAEHRGMEVDSQGDSFFVVFRRAKDAIDAAAAGQRALGSHAWPEGVELRVRMGIHTGQAEASDGRYHGLAVHRAARIGAAAHGGQVLVSQTTRELLEDEEEESGGVVLRDLGEQRLKDLERPVRLHQLVVAGLPGEFPPLRTLEQSGSSSGEIPQLAAAFPRRLNRRVLAAAGVLVAAVILAVVLLARGGGGGVSSLPFNAVGVIDPKTDKLAASIPVGQTPVAIAYGLGSVWVANQDDGTVSRIDAKTYAVRTIGVTGTPLAVAVGDGAVWVTTEEGHLFKVNAQFNLVSELPVRVQEQHFVNAEVCACALGAVAAGGGAVWALWTGGGEVLRVDPASGRIGKRIHDPSVESSFALGAGAVWLSELNTVSRLDTATDVLTGSAQTGALTSTNQSTTVAVGEGSVWAAEQVSGDVWQVSPASTTAVGRTAVGAGLGHIAAGEGGVWVARPQAGTVVRIDPQTGKVTKAFAVGSGAYGLTTGAGRVWVTTVRPGTVRDTRGANT